MKKLYKICTICIMLCAFTSCIRFINWEIFAHWDKYRDYRPDSIKMVGTWMAEDSAIIVLNDEGTCSLKNVRRVIPNSGNPSKNDTSHVWSFEGHWYIKPVLAYSEWSGSYTNDTIGYVLHLNNKPPHRKRFEEGEYELKFKIHNEKVSNEIVPVMLYNFIGDPDNFEIYDFHKQE